MSRDIKLLHPVLQEKCAWFALACLSKGYKIGISETFRTVAEQDALYAKGRTVPGTKVTNAKGSSYSSMHQWGVAFDIYRNDGKGPYYNKDHFFEAVGKIGQDMGLEWGGAWKSFVDLPHFQLPDWGSTTTKLKSLYGTPDKFKQSWGTANLKPEETKKVEPLTKTSDSPSLEDIKSLKAIANLPKFKVIAKNGLNMRSGPGTNYKVVKVLPYNSELVGTIEPVNNGFVHCASGSTTGWVSQKYIKKV